MAARRRNFKRRLIGVSDSPRGTIQKPSGLILPTDKSHLFDRVAQEVLHQDRALFDGLNKYEQDLVVRWLSDAIVDPSGHSALHDVLWEIDYHTKPVDIKTFLHDPYYLGKVASELHPKWKEDMYEIFRPGSPVFEWLMCMTGDTVIPLLDGSMRTLQELHAQFELDGLPVWIYSVDQTTGEVVPGECSKVTKFARDDVFEVTFEDGTSVRANADHEFVCRDGVKRKLRDLAVGDRLMPFYTRHQRQKGQRLHEGYEQVYLPGPKKYAYTHRVVGRMLAGGSCPLSVDGDRAVLHHIDFDCTNNAPENLRWMGWASHRELHRTAGKAKSERWRRMVSERQHRECLDPNSPIRKGHRKYIASARGKAQAVKNLACAVVSVEELRKRGAKGAASRWSDPEQHKAASVRCRARSKGNSWGSLSSRVRSDITVDRIYAAFESGGSLSAAYKHLGASRNAVVRVLREAGLTIENVKQGYRNHRIVSIEPCGREHVYCLTVPAHGNFAVVTDLDRRRGFFSGNTGAIGIGKTTLASIGLIRKIYEMSCLRDAASYYGLLPESLIVFGIYSITKHQVSDTGYFMVKGMIDSSPYFRLDFSRNMKLDSTIDFGPMTGKKIKVVPGSQELHALGLDLFAFMMDEVNFMRVKQDKELGIQTGQAYSIYNATYTRLQSRFIRPGGTLPGMMFLLSSRNAQTSFLEEHLREVNSSQHSHSTHISDYPLWDVKPAHRFTMRKFKVEVGDRTSKSRVLSHCELKTEGVKNVLKITGEDAPRLGARIVEVPGEFYKPFTRDLDQALRDIAGVATFNLSPLIHDRQSVFDAFTPGMSHPFSRETLTVTIEDDVQISEFLDIKKIAKVKRSKWTPLLNPTHPRFIHVDIGVTGDAYGFAMGHVAGKTRIEQLNVETGLETVVEAPVVVIDLMFRAQAPAGQEVELLKGVTFIRYLAKVFNIAKVTFDGFQSTSSIQMLNKGTKRASSAQGAKPLKANRGIETGPQSVDRTEEAYLMLRAAHFERRIAMYHYQPYEDEILDLQRDIVKKKVDHPTKATKGGGKGSKDVTDAVAGVVWLCLNDPRAMSLATLPDYDAPKRSTEKQAKPDVIPAEGREGGTREVGKTGTRWADLRKNV